MAPKIIDKLEKRDELLQKAYDFITQFGIQAFSTASFIQHFNIGKSSLYHYFRSKDEIIYELYYRLALKDIERSQKQIKAEMNLLEKLETVFEFYLSTDPVNKKFQQLYYEFLSTQSNKKQDKMQQYDHDLMQKMQELLEDIFQQEINKQTIHPQSLDLINAMIVTSDGMLLYSFALEDFDLSSEFGRYLQTTVEFISI